MLIAHPHNIPKNIRYFVTSLREAGKNYLADFSAKGVGGGGGLVIILPKKTLSGNGGYPPPPHTPHPK